MSGIQAATVVTDVLAVMQQSSAAYARAAEHLGAASSLFPKARADRLAQIEEARNLYVGTPEAARDAARTGSELIKDTFGFRDTVLKSSAKDVMNQHAFTVRDGTRHSTRQLFSESIAHLQTGAPQWRAEVRQLERVMQAYAGETTHFGDVLRREFVTESARVSKEQIMRELQASDALSREHLVKALRADIREETARLLEGALPGA